MTTRKNFVHYNMKKNELTSLWEPTNPQFNREEPMQVGGQAVIEGVMMRAKGMIATAVRRPSGEIVVMKEEYRSIAERYPLFKIPILRGAVGLIEMMYIGVKTLNYSAGIAMEGTPRGKSRKEQTAAGLIATLVFSLGLGICIFFFLPLFIATRFFSVEQSPFAFNVVAGAVRIAILLLYLYGISLSKDIHRLFQYHGAEHKAVFTFEQDAPLEVDSALRYTRFHPRCGTSFILIVMVLSIILFSFLDQITLLFVASLTLPLRLMTHLPFVPIVGGISYEFLRYSAKHSTSPLGRILVAPGLWLQKITTKEPDENQMQVSLAALKAALRLDDAVQTRQQAAVN